MAIATVYGHVSRAVDFYNKVGKYFSIGRTTPWDNETNPPAPNASTFKVDELVALKKVDNAYLVVRDDVNGTITYRDSKWRIVQQEITTTVGTGGVSAGSYTVPVVSLSGIVVGIKIRVNNLYEGKILSINNNTSTVTLDTAAPSYIPAGSVILSGAYVEQAKFVYVTCSLNYTDFPIVTYRQIGFQTNVTPNDKDVLRSGTYNTENPGVDEFTSAGILEILDNRSPVTRTPDQSETISLIIEF